MRIEIIIEQLNGYPLNIHKVSLPDAGEDNFYRDIRSFEAFCNPFYFAKRRTNGCVKFFRYSL